MDHATRASFWLAASLLSAPLFAGDTPPALQALRTPNEIVAAAPAADWVKIAPEDLLVMDLAADEAGKARRVVIQLIPAPFSQGWTDNIRTLVKAHWYDGIAVVRVQDNYVVQWGDPHGEEEGRGKPLPHGLNPVPESAYVRQAPAPKATPDACRNPAGASLLLCDQYAAAAFFVAGFPAAGNGASEWPVHCYGSVGVGRNVSPDTGTGAELYAVIGHAPRQLDRNIAVVGRVIEGIEYLSSLPRGTGPLGFYETAAERTPILKVRIGTAAKDLPAYEFLSTASSSFAAYADKRANRKDDFYIQPAGGVDICNVPVPVRRVQP
jgi:cyclophilin family peptidyl-prolyl cis-trans isomerase